jgi:DNA-binding CsgD family transcriptional regulator
MDAKRVRAVLEAIDRSWGTGATLPILAPGRSEDRAFADWWARFERLSASPGAAAALFRMAAAIDVRDRLADVRAPTLVLHAQDDPYASVEGGRQLARAIAGARFVELPGRDHPLWLGDVERIADAIEEFLTGARPLAAGSGVLAVLLVARVELGRGGNGTGREARFLDERIERFRESGPRILDRGGGRLAALAPDRLVGRFDSPARAAATALALRESAAALGLPVGQGIHVGEIDLSQQPLFGRPLDVAAAIAAAARPGEILMSRIAGELVSGSGLQLLDRDALAVEGAADPLPIVAVEAERHLEPARRRPRAADAGVLSAREREVLQLVSEGLSNPHIAVRLGLSEHTVKRHVANILLKLDLPTRAAAAALMARQPAG